MRLGVLVLLAGSLVMSACAKSDRDAGVDNGFCTQSTIDSFNNIVSNKYATSTSSVDSVIASCKDIQGLLGGRSCKAQALMTGEEKSISYADVQAVCEAKVKMKSEAAKKSSKYIDTDGNCTLEFAKDAKVVADLLDEAVKSKSKSKAYDARYKCAEMGVELGSRTCNIYDKEKKETVRNSTTEGYLGVLCKGAKTVVDNLGG